MSAPQPEDRAKSPPSSPAPAGLTPVTDTLPTHGQGAPTPPDAGAVPPTRRSLPLREVQAELKAGRLQQAHAVLRQCELKLCGWEHDYLLRQTMKLRLDLAGHTYSVLSVAFSPDGKRIASGSDDRTVKVWDLQKPPNLKRR